MSLPAPQMPDLEWKRLAKLQIDQRISGYPFPSLDSAPDSPQPGFTYYDTALNKVRAWNGTTFGSLLSTVSADLAAGAVYKINGVQVVGPRKTGWAVDTGTAKRTANATYSGTAGAGYVQATMQTLMDAVRDLSQTVKALKDDLHGTAGHGLIGT